MRFNKLLGKIHLKSKGVTMEINCSLEIRQLTADKKKIKKKWQRIRATDDIKQLNRISQTLRRHIAQLNQ